MRFGILGPLRVGGGESTVTAGRDRIVLAMLLLRAGRLVPVDELVDAVWEDRPPATARAQLQTCVSRLRRRFAELGLAPELIVTDPAGYGVRTATDRPGRRGLHPGRGGGPGRRRRPAAWPTRVPNSAPRWRCGAGRRSAESRAGASAAAHRHSTSSASPRWRSASTSSCASVGPPS